MKKQILILLGTILSTVIFTAQEKDANTTFLFSHQASSMTVVEPTFDEPVYPLDEDGKTVTIRNNMRRNKFTNSQNALPLVGDPILQTTKASHSSRAPIVNFDGIDESQGGGANPPDPSGAVGPNHYVQMVNSVYRIFDKSGNPLTSPATLGSLLGGGNAGDPIVMYDKFADRWFLSQFSQSNELIVAISQTPDPTGAYYLYTFGLPNFPDYPKYSVWSDGYYVTSNKSGESAYVLERDKMIAGDNTASIIGFTIPSLTTGGFFSVLPATASSTLPPVGTPNYLFYFEDDAWSGGTDQLKIWEVNVDWVTTSNSSISSPQALPVSPFDSEFQTNWNDIEQPGTSSRIDAVPGALMYMGHYRSFGTHNSIVLNHTVDVNGSDLAGIRWYELRKTGANPWSLYQEGTFNPDTESRWMGSIAMDYQGNIGLAYSVSGHTTYPSIKYTGRYASDPLGQMTIAEEVIVNGTGIQSGTRFGDYAQMTIDPTDDATFWFTGEYMTSEWKTRIASFKIANDFNHDIGVSSVTSPVTGTLSNSESITVNVTNYGLQDQINFPVSYQVNGGVVITQNYTRNLTSGTSSSFTFATPADLSVVGTNYNIKAYTDLSTDLSRANDTTLYTVKYLGQKDVGVTLITAPTSNSTLGNSETITVTVENFGTQTQTNFPIHYSVNNGTVVNEFYTGSLIPNTTASYSFTTTADFSALGTFDIVAYTSLSNDIDLQNDTATFQVEHTICLPESDCSYGDGFTKVELHNLNNNTNCSPNGYGDYTSMIAVLEQGVSYDLILQSGYNDQHMNAWIDFNDNYTFELNERGISDFQFGSTLDTVSLAIQSNAPLGEHLMRLRTNWQASIADACTPISYGETEDYKVNIISFTGIEAYENVAVTVLTKGNNHFEIAVSNFNEDVEIEVNNSIGQKIVKRQFNASNTYQLDLSNLVAGYYLIKISNKNINKVQTLWVK